MQHPPGFTFWKLETVENHPDCFQQVTAGFCHAALEQFVTSPALYVLINQTLLMLELGLAKSLTLFGSFPSGQVCCLPFNYLQVQEDPLFQTAPVPQSCIPGCCLYPRITGVRCTKWWNHTFSTGPAMFCCTGAQIQQVLCKVGYQEKEQDSSSQQFTCFSSPHALGFQIC